MKVALGQINTTVGALKSNALKMAEMARRAKREQADLVVFHEMATTGYPPKDLLDKRWFVQDNLKALDLLAQQTKGIGVIVGYVEPNPTPEGKRLFNAAALLADGKVVSKHAKSLLPTYDVFDEGRYFEPASSVTPAVFKGLSLGLSICEDIWNDKDFFNTRTYHVDPIADLVAKGAGLIIAVNASPYAVDKRAQKHRMLQNLARKHHRPLLYVNQVGANDSLIFDGASVAFSPDGHVVVQAYDFREDLVIFDTATGSGTLHTVSASETEAVWQALLLGIRDYVWKCGFRKVIVGLSGGIDSSVTAALAAEALGPENVLGLVMPSQYNPPESTEDAHRLATTLRTEFMMIPISALFGAYLDAFRDPFRGLKNDITEENLQARIRGNILMALSNKFGHLVLGTGNKSEIAMGYCTLYGDMAGGLMAIGDVPKTMVYQLARHANRDGEVIPQRVIDKPPSAELRPGQRDTDSLPPYDLLDPILKAYIEESKGIDEIVATGHDSALVQRIITTVDRNEYKRQQAAPTLRVTSKAFGYGRRMPIAAHLERLT